MPKTRANQQPPENIVKMVRNIFGGNAGFEFSKVKLKTRTINLTDLRSNKVKNVAKPPIPSTHNHRLDFLTLTIPFLCLLLVTVIIFLVNMFKTSLLSSPSQGPGYYRYSKHDHTPDIHIIEPTNSTAAREIIGDDDSQDIIDEDFIYLTPMVK